VLAREPQPASGATDVDVDVDVVLSWRAGREAAKHDVYISTDGQAVMDGTADVTTVTDASHGPLPLDLGQTYYWKVNEVNEVETTTMWEGDVWDFRTQDYFVVEDFEDYNDYPGHRIYETWSDGWQIATNGATIGYPEPPPPGEHILETTNVHGDEQALPFFYDNTIAASSEAKVNIAELTIGSDWTKNGVKSLSLWFYGDQSNSAEQMYVKLNGFKVPYDGDASNISKSSWRPFNINLADFADVDLSSVTELIIGFERGAGGTGIVLFDDIRLYPLERQFVTPVEPNNVGLLMHLGFDEGFGTVAGDLSGNGNDGTLNGGPQWVAGMIGGALEFDGVDDFVEVPHAEILTVDNEVTVMAWINAERYTGGTAGGDWQGILAKGNSPRSYSFYTQVSGALHFSTAGFGGLSSETVPLNEWVHVAAMVIGGQHAYYINGEPAGTSGSGINLPGAADTATVMIGRTQEGSNEFLGMIDDVRIYDRALSWAEIAWLGGVTEPFDEPF